MPVPTRQTSERDLDQWNQQLRASPVYLDFMRSQGLGTDGRVRLSDRQQADLERRLASSGMAVPSGMHIDQGGNLNQKNTLLRNIGIGAAIGGGALTGLGALGAFGGAGAGGAGAAASAVPAATGAAGAAGAGGAAMAAGSGGILSGLSRLLQFAGPVSELLTGAARGAAGERGDQNAAAQNANQTRANLYGTQQGSVLRALENLEGGRLNRANLDLSRRNFSLNAPSTRADQSIRGSMMANLQDARVDAPAHLRRATITGGMRPSVLGDDTRALGREMMAKSLRDQMAGDEFEDVPETDFQGGLIPTPEMEGYREPGGLESTLSAGGSIGGILSAITELMNQRRQPVQVGRV